MNARSFADFWKTRTGNIVLFGILIIIGGVAVYGVMRSRSSTTAAPPDKKSSAPAPVDAKRVNRPGTEFNVPAALPYAGPATNSPSAPTSGKPVVLPLSLFAAPVTPEISDTYAPYGRLISCETIITIDSARISTPIIGLVTQDVYHDGKLIIPAGAEVHGHAQTDRERERIASENQWMLVWRTTDRLNGAELPLKGIALDMERDATTGRWALTDGSAGLKGDLIKSDNLAEIKLFAATFLSAASSGLQDTQMTSNPLTGASQQTPLDSPKNAALQATSAVINRYADQIAEAIKKDGFYVRVPAGKQFYLYVTQTIDQEEARKGQSKLSPAPTPSSKPDANSSR